MTREEALKYINDLTEKSENKLDETVRRLHLAIDGIPSGRHIGLDVNGFISIMFDVIRFKWSKQYPETFLTCYVTSDEYDRLPKAMYTYYIKTVNGSLNEFMKINGLDDSNIHSLGYTDENRLEMFRKRLKIIEELMDDGVDIVRWCMNSVCLN